MAHGRGQLRGHDGIGPAAVPIGCAVAVAVVVGAVVLSVIACVAYVVIVAAIG